MGPKQPRRRAAAHKGARGPCKRAAAAGRARATPGDLPRPAPWRVSGGDSPCACYGWRAWRYGAWRAAAGPRALARPGRGPGRRPRNRGQLRPQPHAVARGDHQAPASSVRGDVRARCHHRRSRACAPPRPVNELLVTWPRILRPGRLHTWTFCRRASPHREARRKQSGTPPLPGGRGACADRAARRATMVSKSLGAAWGPCSALQAGKLRQSLAAKFRRHAAARRGPGAAFVPAARNHAAGRPTRVTQRLC